MHGNQPNRHAMKPIREIWPEAYTELLKPYPSFKLNLWPKFTEVTGGFRTREFSILCGATGTGKTTLLANISANLLLQQVKHYVASVETGHCDFTKRVTSALLREDINTGEPVELKKLQGIYRDYSNVLDSEALMLGLFDNRISCEELLHELEEAHAQGCKIAMLDNLNFFLEITSAQNERVEMDRVVHEIIMFCKRIDMHVIMVMHPKKTDHGRVESEFDIKGSSTAVQEAHNVFLFNRPSEEDQSFYPSHTFRELKIAKLRRRGKYVGRRLMFRNVNTCYIEADLL